MGSFRSFCLTDYGWKTMKAIFLVYALFLISMVAIAMAAGIEGKGKYVQCSPCATDCVESAVVDTPVMSK